MSLQFSVIWQISYDGELYSKLSLKPSAERRLALSRDCKRPEGTCMIFHKGTSPCFQLCQLSITTNFQEMGRVNTEAVGIGDAKLLRSSVEKVCAAAVASTSDRSGSADLSGILCKHSGCSKLID